MRARARGGLSGVAVALAAAVVALVVGPAIGIAAPVMRAASWHLDTSFGEHGVGRLPARDAWSLLVPGADGTLFVGGTVACVEPPLSHEPTVGSEPSEPCAHVDKSIFVARLTARGKLVKGFGRDGIAVAPAIQGARIFALTGGRVLIAGEGGAGLELARLTARGQMDRTFGHDGVAQYELPARHLDNSRLLIDIEPDGDILAVYQDGREGGVDGGRIAFLRLTPSGALDRSFGKDGSLEAAGGAANRIAPEGTVGGIAISPNGSVLLAVEGSAPGVEEFDPGGMLVTSFGVGGLAALPHVPLELLAESAFTGLFALPAGGAEVAFAGSEFADNPHAFLGKEVRSGVDLFRFMPSGRADPAFGSSGVSAIGPSAIALGPGEETFTVALRGRALVLGGVLASGAPDPALDGNTGTSFTVGLRASDVTEITPVASAGSLSVLDGSNVVRIGE